jgi:trans-aconitate methyltransferase
VSATTENVPTGRHGTDWAAWQASWDRQQEWYLPDREERFRVMLDLVQATVGDTPRVLDLACGTGSITDRLLQRFPAAHSTGVDLDPALLTIARGYFAADGAPGPGAGGGAGEGGGAPAAGRGNVSFVTADLKAADWPGRLPAGRYDAVLTATALHWLHSDELRALYGQLAALVRPGGVFLNADHMPDPATPRINAAESAQRHARMDRAKAAGVLDWRAWWQLAAADPALAAPTAERFRIYGEHADGDTPPAAWHAQALRDAGFAEARTVWSSPSDAMVLALR